DAIMRNFHADSLHAATTRLVAIENTHNKRAGAVLPAREVKRIAGKAKELGLLSHCDGARLWNAAIALGESEATLAEPLDSVAVCFSKGLGAPVGSALAGKRDFIARARK